jgi:hypothetical protein
MLVVNSINSKGTFCRGAISVRYIYVIILKLDHIKDLIQAAWLICYLERRALISLQPETFDMGLNKSGPNIVTLGSK